MKKIISISGIVLLLLCIALVMPVFAFDKVNINDYANQGKDPLKSEDMKGANSLMWDTIKLLSILFIASVVANAALSGTSLNASGIIHSVQIRAHGISGFFIAVGSVVGVGLTIIICFYVWNNYFATGA